MRAHMPEPGSDPDVDAILDALDASEDLDATRIEVVLHGEQIVLRGWVAGPEEANAAVLLAESVIESATPIVDDLQVDPNLREGIDTLQPSEPATPAADEVLVGEVDMLAGPDSLITTDVAEAIEESEPWTPPDNAILPDPVDARPNVIVEDDGLGPVEAGELTPAASDLTAEEVRAGHAPALDPTRDPGSDPPPQPTQAPLDDITPAAEPMPDFAMGDGATGQATVGGGSVGGTPAVETGAKGVDSAKADPARKAGGTSNVAGTHRGPASDDEPAIRGPFPDEDADEETR
jgi:hypothetical protein